MQKSIPNSSMNIHTQVNTNTGIPPFGELNSTTSRTTIENSIHIGSTRL